MLIAQLVGAEVKDTDSKYDAQLAIQHKLETKVAVVNIVKLLDRKVPFGMFKDMRSGQAYNAANAVATDPTKTRATVFDKEQVYKEALKGHLAPAAAAQPPAADNTPAVADAGAQQPEPDEEPKPEPKRARR